MTKKKVLIAFGILFFLIFLVQTPSAQSVPKCTSYNDITARGREGDSVSITQTCSDSGEYAVLLRAWCRGGALLSQSEQPYGKQVYAQCDKYVTWNGYRNEHSQVVHIDYACCKYDEPDDSPVSDRCDFKVAGIDSCPDVVHNQTNINSGWMFPTTYSYQALDCHPEDDSRAETYPQEESAGDDVSASTASGSGICSTNFDEDCDGITNEPDACEADANRTICESSSCAIGGGACEWKTSSTFRGQACCGDDISYTGSDCGRFVSNSICSDDGWLSPAADRSGLISPDGCGGEIVLDSTSIYRCQPEAKPRAFNIEIIVNQPFYFYTEPAQRTNIPRTYKSFSVGAGLTKLGNVSAMVFGSTISYHISSDDSEIKLTFADSDADALMRFKENNLVNDVFTIQNVYAFYTPNMPNSFIRASISKDNDAHDYICYEKSPATNDETRIIAECNGDINDQNTAFSSQGTAGEIAYTGTKIDPSLIFEDDFSNIIPTPSRNADFNVQGITETLTDNGVNVSSRYHKLIYDAAGNINAREGLVEFWIKPNWNSTTDTRERVLFNYQEIVDSYLRISKLTNGMIECKYKTPASLTSSEEVTARISLNMSQDSWHNIKMSWSPNALTCSASNSDGTLQASQTSSAGLRTILAQSFSLGMIPNDDSLRSDAVFDNLKIYKTMKPTAYYCTDNFLWKPKLDDDATACQQASDLKWTGTHCCGELIDTPEYYNDNGQSPTYRGGCWASNWNEWGTLPKIGDSTDDAGQVINYKGQYESCNATNNIISIMDSFTNQQLVHDNPQCTLLIDARSNDKDFYCSVDGNWKLATNDYLAALGQTTNESRTLKNYPWQTNASALQQECCAVNDCWNGNECIRNQRYDATYITDHDYRCLDGNWTKQIPKITWDRKDKGFCPEQSQCLVNPAGSEANNNEPQKYFTGNIIEQPQCIQNSQYIKQYYCENGNWSSRTKLIALQLIDFASSTGDYELLCGDFSDVLTHVGYEAISGAGAVQNYIRTCSIAGTTVPCTNQFCAIKYRDGVAFGTSLNIDVDDSSKSFVKYALGRDISACSQAKNNDDNYDSCGNNIYYNNNTWSIIKIPTGSLPQTTTAQLLANRNFEIQNRFNAVKNYAQTSALISASGNKLVNTTSIFENIFLIKKGNKDFFAYFEEKQFMERPDSALIRVDDIGAHYSNFVISDNPCGINHIGQKTTTLPYSCSYLNNNLNFIGIYPESQDKPTTKQLWRGITGLLRIS